MATSYIKGFTPYALAAFAVGIVGGISSVLGPAFVQDLGLPYVATTWTALAQAMSTAACAPILGKLTDLFGRKRTLMLGIAVFLLGNVLTAMAGSLLFMLIARFTVGIGMAAIAPAVLAYIVTDFPRDKIAKGFSVYMLISSAAVIFGPTLGSFLLQNAGWRVMVWVCAAICGGTWLLCLPFREKNITAPLRNFDISGAVLTVIFFSLVLCIPSFGQNFGWASAPFLGVLAAAAVGLLLLFFAQRRAKNPILPGSFIFRKTFLLSILALFLTQGLLQASMTNTVIFLRHTQPNDTLLSGYALSVMYLGMSLGAVLIGPLADRFAPKAVLTGSFALTALGCAAGLLYGEATSSAILMGGLGILGFGLGGNATIFMKVVLSGLSPAQAGSGTGTYGLFRDLAAPFGVAVFVPLFTNRISASMAAVARESAAAVESARFLSVVEIICVIAGIAVVLALPKNKRSP